MTVIIQRWLSMRMRRAATRYAEHGWPVIPGAVLIGDRYLCGPVCPTVGCHPAIDQWEQRASHDPTEVGQWWTDQPHSVLLTTGYAFDVIEIPGRIGALAMADAPPGPVATTPTGTWMFLVSPGQTLRPELASRLDVVLHGRGSWIPVPPTRTPGDQVLWRLTPDETRWRVPDSYAVQRALIGHALTVGSATVTQRHPEGLPRSREPGDQRWSSDQRWPWNQHWSPRQRWAHRIGLSTRQRWSSRNVDTPVARSIL